MRKLVLLFLLAILPLAASADVEIDGIVYYFNSELKTATVTYNTKKYSGDIVIPKKVTYNDIEHCVTAIENSAFYGCSNLTSVVIPNSVTTIGNEAFYKCSNLISISIPNNVISIGESAFEGCSNLTSVTISNCVTTIEKKAFANCNSLASVTIPNSVTSIGENAFDGCSSLSSVVIGNSVTSIGKYAFSYCSNLNSLTLPNSVTSIGGSAFEECSKLTYLMIGNGITTIGNNAFKKCNSLASVHISDLEAWCKISFGGSYSNPLSYAHHLFLDDKELTELTIPNSITSIRGYAFYGCSSLTSLTITSNVTTISNYAFSGCNRLTYVSIPNSVTYIGESAFQNCCELTSVTIPNTVSLIPYHAFDGCSGLTSVTIPNSVTTIRGYAFSGCNSLTSLIIPNSVTTIGEGAFSGCGLINLSIGNGVTSIGESAFNNCSQLTSVHISDLEAWCKISFGDNLRGAGWDYISNPLFYAHHLFLNDEEITELTIPSSITSIEKCFLGCSGLTSVTFHDNVTTIGKYAFRGCLGLTSVTIPSNVTSIGESAFYCCVGLSSVTIPNSVTSIGEYAFYGCSSLTSVTIPNNVTSIGRDTFSECNNLRSVTIGNKVTSIGQYAFYRCFGLTSVTIPNSVTSIGEKAFFGCRNLSNIYCMAIEVPESDSNDKSYYQNLTLHVPKGCYNKYAAVEPWKSFKEIVEMDDLSIFPDCPPGEIRDAAIYLYNKGIVEGENGLLLAERKVTRAETSKTSFYGVYDGPDMVPTNLAVDNYPSVYTDLQDHNTYYYRPAKALLYLEYGDGVTPFDRNRLNFEPTKTIQRQHVLKVLLESFNIAPDLKSSDNPFPNDDDMKALANSNPMMMGYIRQAANLGVITKANDSFRPFDECTRGELFLMLARIMRKIEAGEIDNPNPQESSYFQPLNTTLKTIGLGASLQMGNFQHYTKTSFALNGVVPLAFAHSYNSYNTTLPSVFFGDKSSTNEDDSYQPLGDGWSHNYHSFVTVVGEYQKGADDNGLRAIVHWGGGSIDVYKSDGSQIVPESMGVYDDFSLVDNEVVIKSKSQMEYRFSMQGGAGSAVFYLYSIKDRNGNELKINYENGQNGSKRINSVSDGQRSLKFYYLDGTDLLKEVKDPLNRSIKFAYFDNGKTGKKQLKSFTDAKGNTTTYEYYDLNKAGTSKLLSLIKLPKGNYIKNEYDANYRLKNTESGVGSVPTTKTSVTVQTEYGSSAIKTLSQVDVTRGSQTSSYEYTFNENNVMTEMAGAKNLSIERTYDSTHPELPKTIVSNSTNVSDITYDKKGNVTSVTVKGDGTLTTTMTYDEMNNLTSVTDPKHNKTTYSYDAKGNLTGISAPEGVTASITIGNKGLPTTVTDPMGVKINYEYNNFGNLTKATLSALGLSSTADYDNASRLTSVTNALGRTNSFTYNNNDFLTSETNALNRTTQYAYDANDNLTTITNAKGGVTTMSYDNATDWLTSVEFAGSTRQYTYNKDGSLSTFTKPNGTTLSYDYDELGRVTSDGVNNYSYDNKLRLSSITGGGKTLSLTYDGFNRINGTTYVGHSNSYTYDNNGNCTNINGTTYEYDGLNRLTSVSFSGKTITYSYRKDSKLSKVVYPNGMTTTYDYDAVGRLTSKQTKLSNGKIVAGYTYVLDKVGNITEQDVQEPFVDLTMPDEDVEYTYNNANRITKAGNVSYEFDANGNTTKRGNVTYTWDMQDRLTTAGTQTITYDPLGLIASYGDITFTTDPLGIGNVLSDSKSGAQYIYGIGLEARVIDGKVSYYVTDVRGSVVAVVDESGNITHKYQYDEFGKVTLKKEADYNPFQYVGKYGVMCLNNHLYYMRARHYDPTIGRFLSEDPIWSTNLYPYADNNPIMGIDPRGLTAETHADLWLEKRLNTINSMYESGKMTSEVYKRFRRDSYKYYMTLKEQAANDIEQIRLMVNQREEEGIYNTAPNGPIQNEKSFNSGKNITNSSINDSFNASGFPSDKKVADDIGSLNPVYDVLNHGVYYVEEDVNEFINYTTLNPNADSNINNMWKAILGN